MAIASNLYASKVFSEHPIASWSLDDDISYLSLITEDQRDLENWFELINATESEVIGINDGPFDNSIFTEITAINPSLEIEAYSKNLFNLKDLNQIMNTFAINLYCFTNGAVEYYEYGYRYIDPYSAQYIEDVKRVDDSRFGTWIRMGSTFNPPNVDAEFQIIFRASFFNSSLPSIIINGLSVGQWSESTNNKSLGASSSLLNSEIQDIIGVSYGVETTSYGSSSKNGYILVENNRLLAVNSGIPMVYGSDNVTRLNSSSTLPSLIVPGFGMLNELGKYNSYTMEMWLKIENNDADSKKIWGPLANDYGLYIKRGYISLVIGNSIGSYFISEWHRPMIVHIIVKTDRASVLINGEEVISISYKTEDLVLPNINQDWIGFYCHENMPIFELDCVSIFPYVVPEQVAKRRFVWGQGVESPEAINSAYQGVVSYIDYPFAQYTANQSYPDFSKWDAGYLENLVATRQSLSIPSYELPEVYCTNKTLQNFYDDNYAIQQQGHSKFMSFRPNSTWTGQCYYSFNSLNILTDMVKAIWGVFEVSASTSSTEPLIYFINSLTGDSLKIDITGLTISYKLYKNNSITPTTLKIETISPNNHFVVGLNLPKLFLTFGSEIASFFGNTSSVKIMIGGDGISTFSGLIYRVGFSNQSNLEKIENHFNDNGIAIPLDGDLLNDHLGSYTLLPTEEFNRFYLDIGVSSYWEEYYPLTYFAGYVKDYFGNDFYDLDFIQYNIGYPTTTTTTESIITGSWTYEELLESYLSPINKPYEALDNELISGYANYNDLKNKTSTTSTYDFSQSSVRSYITFQKISDGANKPLSEYSILQSISSDRILDVNNFSNKFTTKFEIKDQSIIYPPKTLGIDNTAMVLHLELNVYGIKTNPLNIRKMSMSSKSLNSGGFNEIGTKFGSKIYPYSKVGIYYDQSKQNPYSIYKDSMPYLYLTKYSGIESLGSREYQIERGISVPINSEKKIKDEVSAIQLWVKYTDDSFPQVSTALFSLDSLSVDISFNVITDQSSGRGRLYSTNQLNGTDYTGLTFYQDGIEVINPYLEKNKWTVIGVNFAAPISFNGYIGSINLFQSAIFNNISYYKSTSLQDAKSIIYRRWSNIAGTIASPEHWQDWIFSAGVSYTWDSVLKLSENNVYGVSPEALFKSYTGTNRQIIDDGKYLNISENGITTFASGTKEATYSSTYPLKTRIVITDSPEWTSYNKKPV